jgi:hypothetical protein
MGAAFKALLKQPYWVLSLILGALLVALPCITVDAERNFTTHAPTTLWLPGVGIALLIVSAAAFAYSLLHASRAAGEAGAGLDFSRVKDAGGVLSTVVAGCEIRAVYGRLEDFVQAETETAAVVLPCNEYFDDQCVTDERSALGAYVNRVFKGQVVEFCKLVTDECARRLGPGVSRQKTEDEKAESFGAGRCLLLTTPLGRANPIALVSTTTQRAGEGLAGRISYLFTGTRELVRRLADARINEVTMPLLGAGHGGIDPPLAFVGLVLALAEAARYGQGAQRLKRATIVVFRRDAASVAQVDTVVVRRALALVGST